MPSNMNQDAGPNDYNKESKNYSNLADAKLLRSIAAGDEQALAELYKRYSSSLLNYLWYLVRQQTTAEDILQELFLAIWKGAANFQGRSTAKTWIFRIAHNLAISWLRREARLQEIIDNTMIADPEDIEVIVTQAWRTDQVLTALDQLTPTHRAVIELNFVHGLSYTEIAQVMDCPVGTVKSRMSYAMQQLNRLLLKKGVIDQVE